MRLHSLYALVAAFGLMTGCAPDTTGPSRPDGTYQLDRVNGGSLPFLAESTSSGKLEIIGGSMAIGADGTFAAQVTSRETAGTAATTVTQQVNGTFTIAGDRLTFTEVTGERYTGVFSGGRLTAQRADVTFEFVRK
jgi:hypothetical protein